MEISALSFASPEQALVLSPEFQSHFSDSTDTEVLSGRIRRFPSKIMPPFWNEYNRSQSKFNKMTTTSDDLPRTDDSGCRAKCSVLGRDGCSRKNFMLDFDEIAKNNKFGMDKKKIFKLRCQENCMHMVEISFLNQNEIVLRFLDDSAKTGQIQMESPLVKRPNIVVEFMKFQAKFKAPGKLAYIFGGLLKNRNGFQCKIDYERIRNCMRDFFKDRCASHSLGQLNDFELLYFGIFVFKKNFTKWSRDAFDIARLQKSETKKRKEHFLKFILKKLFKYLNAQNRHFFGDKNKEIIQRMKSIFFEGARRNSRRDPSSNRMENLGKILSSNAAFKRFYDSSDINSIISDLFREYSRKPMDTLINNHINRLKTYMDEETDPQKRIAHFVKMIFNLKKKKLKNMWTFREFQQAQEVLHYIMTIN